MMKIQVLGGHGGLAKGFSATSFLIDETFLIDAGSVASTLSVEEQCRIENILISHCHLDHTKDIAFLCDNCFGLRKEPFFVHSHATVIKIIKANILNDLLWPDFSKLPTAEKPTVKFFPLEPLAKKTIGGFEVTPVPVQHPHDAMGFILEKGGSSVLFTVDTGPTHKIWEVAKTIPNLKAIFTEVSFPNVLQKVADLSDHHTPNSIEQELKKMPKNLPIILTHLKPNYREQILKELEHLGDRVQVLEQDGQIFHF